MTDTLLFRAEPLVATVSTIVRAAGSSEREAAQVAANLVEATQSLALLIEKNAVASESNAQVELTWVSDRCECYARPHIANERE